MQSSVVDRSLFTSQLLPNTSQPAIWDDKMKASRDFLEELKCLFLQVRNPHKNAIEELVRQIIKCDLNSADSIEWLRVRNRHFDDFQNKLLDETEDLIELFKAT
ncbi:24876_t:CDS:2, partial [Racocetra persica]